MIRELLFRIAMLVYRPSMIVNNPVYRYADMRFYPFHAIFVYYIVFFFLFTHLHFHDFISVV